MDRFKPRQIITALLILLVVAIAIAGLVSIARFLFYPSGTTLNQITSSEEALVSTSADRSVRMTVRGPIVANDDFRSYQIKVTPNESSLTTYSGYLNKLTKTITADNNIPAYEQFVYALNRANLMKGVEISGTSNDRRGVCATGYLYEFQILKADVSVKQLWTSSCSASKGTLNANLSQLTKLFIAQIHDAKKTIDTLW